MLSSAAPNAKAFTHPSVPLNLTELNAVKSKVLAAEPPWKGNYDALAIDWISGINYAPCGIWPAWAEADTGRTNDLFNAVCWPRLSMDIQVLGPTLR